MVNGADTTGRMLQQLDGLYEKDPVRFESLRREIIATTINSFPEKFQQRAYGIQFTLDCELDRIKNPVARMNRMVEIFWGMFAEFQTVINDPSRVINEQQTNKKTGKVIRLH